MFVKNENAIQIIAYLMLGHLLNRACMPPTCVEKLPIFVNFKSIINIILYSFDSLMMYINIFCAIIRGYSIIETSAKINKDGKGSVARFNQTKHLK